MPPIPFHLGGNSMTSQLAFFAQTINFSLPPNLPSRASTDPKERDGSTSVTQRYDLRALISWVPLLFLSQSWGFCGI